VNADKPRTGQDMAVRLRYVLRTHLPDGSVKENPEEEISFIFGVERQVRSLENAIKGRCEREKLHVSIPTSEIYGEYDETLVREIPKKGLMKQRLKEGQFYRQMKQGTLVSFKVLEIRAESVLADFNKPMAGICASMDVEIIGVRKATKAEINAAVEAENKRSIGCG